MKNQCAWRQFNEHNESIIHFNNYHVETLLHELLLQSNHRWEERGTERALSCTGGCC